METFVKIGCVKISLAAQKIWVAQNLGGGGRVGSPQFPRRLWVLYHLIYHQSHVWSKRERYFVTDQLETVCVVQSLNDDGDRGKIKEQKYPENAVKNKSKC